MTSTTTPLTTTIRTYPIARNPDPLAIASRASASTTRSNVGVETGVFTFADTRNGEIGAEQRLRDLTEEI